MPWKAIPFENLSNFKSLLSSKYSVSGIPQLTILDAQGQLVSNGGRFLVSSQGAKGYPFVPSPQQAAALEADSARMTFGQQIIYAVFALFLFAYLFKK
jgi:hypothetical protein